MQDVYVIGNITVKDEEKWARYKSKVPATLRPWQGKLVFRGHKLSVLSGANNHSDNVIISFPSQELLDGWFNSKEYQALIPLRQQAADIDLISYQSV